ncbi:MAG: exo-alpha-sialidase [Clostridia bacterium]|nr:exo-alpha-sialidase [Clostridia bacterium]
MKSFEKIFFTKENLTSDTDSSLKAPCVFGREAADSDFYSAEKRKWQSAPCICKTSDGSLYCTFSGDNFGGDEAPNNYNIIMKSTDGGNAWETVNIIDHMDSVRMHEPILWTDNDGTLWHFWAQSYNWWDGRGGVWAMKLEDADRMTWSEPKRLCHGVMACPPVTLSGGEIALPVSIWKRYKGIHHLPEYENSGVYISTDNGKSFTYAGGANAPESDFDENTLVERADGSLFMTIRCSHSIDFSVSYDKGKTWSKAEKLMDHTSSRSYLAKLPGGNFVLVTNDDAEKRSRMTAFLSTDDCKTFDKKLLLFEKSNVSYPAGCVDKDGRIYVAYDFNRYIDEEIYFASITEADIAAGEITDKGSFTSKLISKGGSGRYTDKVYETGENNQ